MHFCTMIKNTKYNSLQVIQQFALLQLLEVFNDQHVNLLNGYTVHNYCTIVLFIQKVDLLNGF
jgi:hypothetical protein